MYGRFPYIYHTNRPIHVGRYTSSMDGMGTGEPTVSTPIFEADFIALKV